MLLFSIQEIPMNLPEKVQVAGSGMKNRYKSIIPSKQAALQYILRIEEKIFLETYDFLSTLADVKQLNSESLSWEYLLCNSVTDQLRWKR